MRQRVAQVPGEAVDEVVLAPVRLVGDDDDVPALAQHREAVALLLGQELLDRREDDPARVDPEKAPQLGPVARLDGRLPEQLLAAGERAEELVVEVVPVGQDDDRRVLHRGLGDDPPRVERHRQALPRPLRVPDDADAPVARLPARHRVRRIDARCRRLRGDPVPRGPERLLDGDVHGVELVVPGDLLRRVGPLRRLEDDEVPDEAQEAPPLERPFEDDPKLRHPGRREPLPRDRLPRHEPFLVGGQRPEPGLNAVGDEEELGEREERGDLGLVRLELLERRPDRRVLVRRVLQLDDGKREAVHEEDDVGPPVVLRLDDRQLVHGEEGVPVDEVEFHDRRLRPPDGPVRLPHLDRHAVPEHPVERAVPRDERRPLGPRDLPERVLDRFFGKARVQLP